MQVEHTCASGSLCSSDPASACGYKIQSTVLTLKLPVSLFPSEIKPCRALVVTSVEAS